jgi:hypothetical protein
MRRRREKSQADRKTMPVSASVDVPSDCCALFTGPENRRIARKAEKTIRARKAEIAATAWQRPVWGLGALLSAVMWSTEQRADRIRSEDDWRRYRAMQQRPYGRIGLDGQEQALVDGQRDENASIRNAMNATEAWRRILWALQRGELQAVVDGAPCPAPHWFSLTDDSRGVREATNNARAKVPGRPACCAPAFAT